MLRDLLQDVRLSARTLARQPAFSAVAVAILALGLGSSLAAFSLVEALVTRVLPYPEPHRLVQLFATAGNQRSIAHTPAALREYQAQARSFESIAGSWRQDSVLEEPGQPAQPVWGLAVTASFFQVLGVRPQLGRLFSANEEQLGRNGVVIISAGMWRDRFASDPQILGRRLVIDGQSVTVVGVMPPSFNETPRYWGRTDLWRPLALSPEFLNDRTFTALDVFARLRPGVSLAAANAELSALAERLAATGGARGGLRAVALDDREGKNDTGNVAVLILGLAVLLLVIACLNLAGLQVARLVARGHEHAIRLALGAGRSRLVRHALAESLLLCSAGGALGLAVAGWWTELLGPRILIDGARRVMGVKLASPLEPRILVLTAGLVLAIALLVGSVPFWTAPRRSMVQALHAGGRSVTNRAGARLRQGLVVVQMALALVLLAAGGLFLRGLSRFEGRDPGWKVDSVLTAAVLLPAARYTPRDVRASFADRLRARLAAIPGAAHVALAWLPPINVFNYKRYVTVEGGPAVGLGPVLTMNGVSPGYFDALGMRLREGRLFTEADEMESSVIVNESAARDLWPGQSAVGKRLADGDRPDRWRTVVGVVSDVRFPAQLKVPESPYQSYLPIRQVPMSFTIVVRAKDHLSPQALAGEVRRAVADVDPALPVLDALSARAQVSRYLSNFSLMGWALFGLAGMGLFLSALAIYGLFSRFVVERTRELGVRMALGAHTAEVLRLVLGKGLRLAAVGAAIGTAGGLMVARLLRSAVTGLPVHDPLVVPALALVLVAVALLACWLPARRAAGLDPMAALRHE